MKKTLKSLSTQHLLNLLNQGSEPAFNEIYNRYWKILYTYAYRIYTEEKICEDIVQEVFISLWNKSKTTEVLNLEGYLFKAIKYKIASYIRDLKFTSTHIEALENIPVSITAEKNMEYEEFEKRVFLEITPYVCYRIDNGKWQPMLYLQDYAQTYTTSVFEWDTITELIPGRRTSNPIKSKHLWRGNIPTNLDLGNHKIEIKATDMFGNTYKTMNSCRLEAPKK